MLLSVSWQVGMPEWWGGVGYNRSAAIPRFQPRTVANPALYSRCPTRIILSPMRQSNMHACQWQGTSEQIHRQRQQATSDGQTQGGTNHFTEWDCKLPCLWHEGTRYSIQEHPKKPLPSSMRIRYCAWACTPVIFPSERFLGFRNCGLEPVTPNMGNTEVSRSKPLSHAGAFVGVVNY